MITYFLSFFSQDARIKFGERVWDELDAKLPEAVGVIEDDKTRMKQFSELLDNLSQHKKKALKAWIEKRIYDLKYHSPDLTGWQEEEFERKWMQIFNEHLRVLKSKTP